MQLNYRNLTSEIQNTKIDPSYSMPNTLCNWFYNTFIVSCFCVTPPRQVSCALDLERLGERERDEVDDDDDDDAEGK